MSKYKVGICAGTRVGSIFADDQSITDECNRLHAEMMAVGQEIRDFIYLPGSWNLKPGVTVDSQAYQWYRNIWEPFRDDWMKFREIHSHWYNNLWGVSWDQVQAYKARLIQMRDAAKKNLNIPFLGPAPTPPTPPKSFLPNITAKDVAIWGGAALTGIALFKWATRREPNRG